MDMELELLKLFNEILEITDNPDYGNNIALSMIIGRVSAIANIGRIAIETNLPTPDTMIVNATPNRGKGFNPYME